VVQAYNPAVAVIHISEAEAGPDIQALIGIREVVGEQEIALSSVGYGEIVHGVP
jgi:hypothetical protein